MRLNPTCWAQDLKNRGGDFFALRGIVVDTSNPRDVKDAIRIISNVTSRGVIVSPDLEHVEIRRLRDEVVLNLEVNELDVANRNSRVALHVQLPRSIPDDYADDLLADAAEFATHAQRTLHPACDDEVRRALDVEKKKRSGPAWRSGRLAAAVAAILLALALVAAVLTSW